MDGYLLLIGAVLMLVFGAFWMTLFWRVIDPWLRRVLGRLLRVNIHLGQQNIWQMELESEDSTNWRNILIRPIQMLALMTAGLIPLVATVIVLVAISG